MPFTLGENVGPYRITAQLGQGGMATVYKAYHAALDRYVALKILHPAFKEDPSFLGRFQREARVVAKLDHPNIVPVYDFAEHNGQPYLVMKYIEGETLKARLARGPLTVAEGLGLLESIGAALAYAHQQGILHRDIKPSNIVLAAEGTIFLTDFGLARMAAAGESTLSQDMLVGTPHYISPEQARGDKDLDTRTDIYSLGVVLYELVVGRVPYSADTPYSIIHDHIFTALPMPRALNPKVPEAMERVLLKSLAKARADRFQDVPALVAAFREAATGATGGVMAATLAAPPATPPPTATHVVEPGATKVVTQPTPATAPKKRSPWIWVGAAALLMICAFGALVGLRGLQKNLQARATANAQSMAIAGATLPPPGATSGAQPTAAPPTILKTTPTKPPQTASPRQDPYALLDEARQAFANKQAEKGFSLLDEAVAINPEDTQVLLAAGDMVVTYGIPFRALEKYYLPAKELEDKNKDEQAVAVFEHTALAMYLLGADDRGEAALRLLTLKYRPTDVPRMALSRWHIFHDQTDLASKEIDTLLTQYPDNYAIYLVRGDLYFKLGQRLEAGQDYARITEKGARTVPAWVLAEAKCNLGKIRQAPLRAKLESSCETPSSLVTGK